MSAESLEDGEIASEHEPSPEPQADVDVDDEFEIDRIIENENKQSTSSQRVINSAEKSPEDSESSRSRRKSSRRKSWKESSTSQKGNFPRPQPLMSTSWLGNGNGRPQPSESVIFGMPSQSPVPEQYLQPPPPPPPPMNQQMMVSADITRLQNIVNHQRDYYQPPRVPYHFFQSPPDHQMRPPLMSIPIQQPPPCQPHRPLPPLLPHPPPQMLQRLPTPPHPQPTANNTSWRHADNYERISMEMSPEEPPAQFNGFVKPPVQIPLDPVITVSSPEEARKKQKTPEVPKVATPPIPPASEDEETLRAFLLANMNPGGKRPASSSSSGTPRGEAEPKRTRKNSAPRLSTSVENIFGAKPVQPPPPVPKIQVNIGKASVAPEPAPEPVLEPEPEPEPTPSFVATIQESELSREEKREQLEKRMQECEKLFKEQKEKVTEAAKKSKVAATMAAKAEELAKQAEKMNQEAVELRQKCIENTRSGKEEMRKILIEKRELQTAIDEMSIDDMEEIDVEEFPCIFFASVKPVSELKEEKPVLSQLIPPVAKSETQAAPTAPVTTSVASAQSVAPQVAPTQSLTSSVAPAQTLASPEAPPQSLTPSRAPASSLVPPVSPSQVLTPPRAPAQSLASPVAPAQSLVSPIAPARNSTTPQAPPQLLTPPRAPALILTPQRAPASAATAPAREERQVGGRNAIREMEPVIPRAELHITAEESENGLEHDQSDDTEEDKMEHVDEEEQDESVEGEDEYETEEDAEDVPTDPVLTSPIVSPLKSSVKEVPTFSRKIEEEMRARLLNKFSKNDATRKSPDAEKVTSSQPDPVEHAAECRAILQKMCKFELNGRCERPRDCQFLHMHNINDTKQQTQILESLFRDVFQYQEADIEGAVAQTMHFLPQFRVFEKLMDQFFRVVVQQTPDYKPRLFQFFAQARR